MSCADVPSSVLGSCASTDGTSVEVEITEEYPADGGGGGESGGSADEFDYDDAQSDSSPDSNAWSCEESGAATSKCRSNIPRRGSGDETQPNAQPASLPNRLSASALADIAPQPAELLMEPNGWAILGQPVNFWTTASEHSISTSLLGHSVTVTFTPVATTYDYGDGTTNYVETPGAPWAEQGLPELSDTHTSHRYDVKQPVTVVATVHYAATVSAGGRSIPVDGTVQSLTASLSFELFESDTYLSKQP